MNDRPRPLRIGSRQRANPIGVSIIGWLLVAAFTAVLVAAAVRLTVWLWP